MKLKFTHSLLYSLLTIMSFGQVDQERSTFLAYRIEELKSKYSFELPIKISGTRLKWDTSEYVFTHYFSRYDTTDLTDLSIKSKPVRTKIVNMMKDLSDQDYDLIRQQIKNQSTDTFIKETVLNDSQRKKRKISKIFYFSQPIVLKKSSIIILKELIKSIDGHQYYQCVLFKKVNQKWIMVTTLETWGHAIE